MGLAQKGCLGCLGVVGIIVVLGFIGSVISPNSSSRPSSSSTTSTPAVSPAQQAAEAAACRNDLKCWAEKHDVEASVRCRRVVEGLAKYQAEWTDGLLEPKFSHYRWKNKAGGVVTYIGDKVKFQNGFGAWQNMVYECDFDGDAKKVVDARAEPGRIPR